MVLITLSCVSKFQSMLGFSVIELGSSGFVPISTLFEVYFAIIGSNGDFGALVLAFRKNFDLSS